MSVHHFNFNQPRRSLFERIFGCTPLELCFYALAVVGIVLVAAEPDESVTFALFVAVKLLGLALVWLAWAVLRGKKGA